MCYVPKDLVWPNNLQPMLLQTFSHSSMEIVCDAKPLVGAAKNSKSHNKTVRLLVYAFILHNSNAWNWTSDHYIRHHIQRKFERMCTLYFIAFEFCVLRVFHVRFLLLWYIQLTLFHTDPTKPMPHRHPPTVAWLLNCSNNFMHDGSARY